MKIEAEIDPADDFPPDAEPTKSRLLRANAAHQ